MKKAAEDGKNVSVIADTLIDDYFNTADNNKVSFIDNIAIPKINEYAGASECDTARGSLLFWRGRTLFGLGKLDEAKADFEKAAGLIDKSDAYYANAVAAMRGTDYMNTYSVPASEPDEYLPIQIGNSWEYDEPHLTEEGYRAKAIFRIASGMNGEYLMTSSQEFICLRTEDEYNEYVKISHKY